MGSHIGHVASGRQQREKSLMLGQPGGEQGGGTEQDAKKHGLQERLAVGLGTLEHVVWEEWRGRHGATAGPGRHHSGLL
jgi:hypothetical protein